MNVCAFIGNLTRDSELREFGNGNKVLNFSVAVEDKPYKKDGDWVNPVQFLDFEVFGPRADSLVSKLVKGTPVALTAAARFNSWEDQEGKKRSKVTFNVDNVKLLNRGTGKKKEEVVEDDDEGGDIPF